MMLNRRKLSLALMALLGAGPSPARAHASMIRSSPQANATVKTAPQQVALYFSERVRAAPDAISVTDQSNTRVDRCRRQAGRQRTDRPRLAQPDHGRHLSGELERAIERQAHGERQLHVPRELKRVLTEGLVE